MRWVYVRAPDGTLEGTLRADNTPPWADPDDLFVDLDEHAVDVEDGMLASASMRARRHQAVVVHADAGARLRLRDELELEGYEVVTCAGPRTSACPASAGPGAPACSRVPPVVDLLVVDEDVAGTRVPLAYLSWSPRARVRVARA